MSSESVDSLEDDMGGSDIPDLNVGGLISILVFYLVVLAVGIWAGWRQRRQQMVQGSKQDQETIIVAGRNIGLFVGILTMGATWVGGGFLNGSAEAAYTLGLVWVQAPYGFSLSLIVGGLLFAEKMRKASYVTMIDPFTQKYGRWGALQAIPSAVSEVFWSASILGALGTTLQVILGIAKVPSIVVSAVIAVLYTLTGGLISVAYTDVFQITFIFIGLFLSLPFALTNEKVSSIDFATTDWRGDIPEHKIGEWIDVALMLLLGGIPWQCYFQRVLSSKTSRRAVLLSFGGCAIAITLAIPSTIFGAVAKATNWTATDYGRTPDDPGLVLPLCLQYLTPQWVSFVGLGGISAAVMSSTDSSMLSASSMLARNVYKIVFRPSANDKEILICLWVLIIVNATVATLLAIYYQSIYGLYVLCGDFVYVIVFPQFLLVLYFDKANTYGSVVSFFLALTLRLLCGDTILKIPATISFGEIPCQSPDCTDPPGPVPFRTIIMLIALVVHVVISTAAHHLFTENVLPLTTELTVASWRIPFRVDFFRCFSTSSSGLVVAHRTRHLYAEDDLSDGDTNDAVKMKALDEGDRKNS